jgi:hypothetical protein
MSIPFKRLGEVGFIGDVLPHELPPNAWTAGQNIRFTDGYVERMTGHIPTYGTPTTAPNWLLPVPAPIDYYWLYASTTAVHVVDSARVHTDITRLAGPYTGNLDINWNGGLLNGIPVINNGVDDPQMWLPTEPSTKLQALTAWPANTKAKVIRAFKSYLFALDLQESGNLFPHKVRWSHAAAAGAVPSSWDVSDPTVDAGQATLPDTGGYVLDALPLRDSNAVYKEDQIWSFQYVGGAKVFNPVRVANEIGMLTRDCAAQFYARGLKHAVFGADDLVVHDGNSVESIADRRVRKWLFNQLSGENYQRCFVVPNYYSREIWFCFVPLSLVLPWSLQSGSFGMVREMPSIRFAASGIVNDDAGAISWDSDSDPWEGDTSAWDERIYGQVIRKVLFGVPSGPSIQYADQGNQFTGVNYTSYIERVGIPFARTDDEGNPEADVNVRKLCTELQPRFEASPGTVIDIYVGAHEDVNEGVTWQGPFPFTVGVDKKINPFVVGRYLAVKFQSAANATWKLHEYALEVKAVGKY